MQFLHRYNDGLLTIIITPGDGFDTVARLAQPDAQISYSHLSSDTLCRNHSATSKEGQTILGCSIK